jgi:hypothetical protein
VILDTDLLNDYSCSNDCTIDFPENLETVLLIMWLNINYYYSNNNIKVAHQNLQISKTRTFRVDCCAAAVSVPPNATINRSDHCLTHSTVDCYVCGIYSGWPPYFQPSFHQSNYISCALCLPRLLLIHSCFNVRPGCSAFSIS